MTSLGILKDSNKIGEPVHHLLATAELRGIIEVRKIGKFVGVGQRGDDFLVDIVADTRLALKGNHVLEARALGNADRRIRRAGVLVANVFDEQQHQDVVLVLARIHPAAQLIAARPEGGVEFAFLYRHGNPSDEPLRTSADAGAYEVVTDEHNPLVQE
jgi:hypothetical protein